MSEKALDVLIPEYIAAKAAEVQAQAKRIALSEAIAEKLHRPREGQATIDLGAYRVTVRQPINRRVDWQMFDEQAAGFAGKQLPVKHVRELDVVGWHWIEENEPELHKALAKAVTATPGRVAIDVKEVTK